MSYAPALQTLRIALIDFQSRSMATAEFCQTWRMQAATVLGALPPRYGQVMEDLLGRLEASSLFTEESCSFSQEDLHANLTVWLDKAQQILGVQP